MREQIILTMVIVRERNHVIEGRNCEIVYFSFSFYLFLLHIELLIQQYLVLCECFKIKFTFCLL